MHNVILIIVSSKWSSFFFPELFIMSHSRFEMLHLLFSGVPSFPHYLIAELHLNHRKASPCVFNFSFFLSSFYYRVFHGGSTWWFVKDSFHSSIVLQYFLSELWSSKLYSKINMVLNTCFVLRSSNILHLAFRSAILSTLSFEMVLCHSWQFPIVFHDSQVVQNDIL